LPLPSPFAIAVTMAVAITITITVTIALTPSPSLVCPICVLIVVSSGGQCHRYQQWCPRHCHGIIVHYFCEQRTENQ
jgi:hypothetical protein